MARKNQDPIEKIIEAANEAVASRIAASVKMNRGTESPIEDVFLTALGAASKFILTGNRAEVRLAPSGDYAPSESDIYQFVVWPQSQIDGYRVDFLICAYDFRSSEWDNDLLKVVYDPAHWRRLIVECDGHDFHERTKEQAARDRKRDRDLSLKGYDVFRFTGSEIWRDPIKCAGDVIQWARFTS